MVKVITYGTYDVLHYGHIRLLERAKALGDYLIVGITADDYDKNRGKINVHQTLMERVEAVQATGIADEIIIEEYEGQKIDDIRKYDIDIFTVGSDWEGKFDYLNEYCKVIYLPRTENISSSDIRSEKREIRLGLVGDAVFLNKVYNESKYVNGIRVSSLLTQRPDLMDEQFRIYGCNDYKTVLENSDAVYIRSIPDNHYNHIRQALEAGKNVLCESPITLNSAKTEELFKFAEDNNLVLMEAIKTAYSTAFSRLILLIKEGRIGDIVSVDATCTSLNKTDWPGIYEWAPTALLPLFELLGTQYDKTIITRCNENGVDSFTRINFIFNHSVASIKVGDGVKAEGQLIISGTQGYIYVPAPWWKTDYFELRYEDPNLNKRYFYQLDGEGIRHELVSFVRSIESGKIIRNIKTETSIAISKIMEDYINGIDTRLI